MSASAFIRAKAERLLVGGCVVIRCGGELVEADVRGDHGTYRLRRSPAGRWECPCPNWRANCSHVEAVRRVSGAHAWVRAHQDARREPSSPVWERLRREADERIARYGRGEPV